MGAVLLALIPLSPAIASPSADRIGELSPVAGEIDARTIARRAENSLRADRTYMRAWVTVRSPEGPTERVVEYHIPAGQLKAVAVLAGKEGGP